MHRKPVDTVANEAIVAALQQTFAVGGAIINNATGEVIAALHNNVLMPFPGGGTTYFLPHDPTAHGERQLVDWYYVNVAPLNLPPPNQLTVVTTLDPCAMCAGSLLTAGFNVAVSAIDDYAGINYNSQFTFPSLPPQIRQQAQDTWGYYAIAAQSAAPIRVRTARCSAARPSTRRRISCAARSSPPASTQCATPATTAACRRINCKTRQTSRPPAKSARH